MYFKKPSPFQKNRYIIAITTAFVLMVLSPLIISCGYKRCSGHFLNNPKIVSIYVKAIEHDTSHWMLPLLIKKEIEEQIASVSHLRLAANERIADAVIHARITKESKEPMSSYDLQTHSLLLSKYQPQFELRLDITTNASNTNVTFFENVNEEYFPNTKISVVETQKNVASIHAAQKIAQKIIERLVSCE